MKPLFLLLLLPVFCFGQKYALLDKQLKLPIIYTDSVTVEQVHKGFFPVKNESVDTLVANLLYLKDMLSKLQRSKAERFELHAASTAIKVQRVPFAYGDRYNIGATSKAGEVNSLFMLSSADNSNKNGIKKIDALLKYLKSNKDFFKEPNEIQPKIYEVYIISE